MHRVYEFFRIGLASALLWSGLLAAAGAANAPSLYGAQVPDADAQQAAQDAMRIVLVRLTGHRDAATDPSLSGLISDASHYVQLQRVTTSGGTQILFDGNALTAAIAATGRSVWNPDRPQLWVWLPQQDAAVTDDLRQRLQNAALARGVPISITVGSPADQAGGVDALLAVARRGGGNAALQALPGANDPATLQWSLAATGATGQWSGTPESAIDGATDALVRASQELEAAPLTQFDCRVLGVTDLPGYAAVIGAVSSTPGVTDVAVRAIDADTLTLQLKAHGTQATLERALSGERLRSAGAGENGALEYRYQAGS